MNRFVLWLGALVLASCSQATLPQAGPVDSAGGALAPTSSSNYAILYSFGAPPDGNTPVGSVTLAAGKLYGVTYGGGKANGACANGCGTIYSIDPYQSSHPYTQIYSFQGGSDGATPESGLNPNGAPNELFGTTFFGGRTGRNCDTNRRCGTVFELGTSSSQGAPTVLYRFEGGSDGANPWGARQIVMKTKTYYGTTEFGGAKNFGTVYAVTVAGAERVVYAFAGGNPGKGRQPDGAYPSGDLSSNTACGASCTFYGTTLMGGRYNAGTIFELIPAGSTYKERVLYSFSPSVGDVPVGVENRNGTLYGAASRDGANNRGSIFAYSIASHKFSVIHAFTGSVHGHDGALPYARPIYYNDAVYGPSLYGTTQGGGRGLGTVFRVTLSDNKECVIHSFPDPTVPGGDGLRPEATLRQFSALGNNFFGTTLQGPAGSGYYNKGYGTVFEISPEASCS